MTQLTGKQLGNVWGISLRALPLESQTLLPVLCPQGWTTLTLLGQALIA